MLDLLTHVCFEAFGIPDGWNWRCVIQWDGVRVINHTCAFPALTVPVNQCSPLFGSVTDAGVSLLPFYELFSAHFPQFHWNRLINLQFYNSRWASLKEKKENKWVYFCHHLTKRLVASCKDKCRIKSSASTYSREISVFVSLNAAFHIHMDQYLTPNHNVQFDWLKSPN